MRSGKPSLNFALRLAAVLSLVLLSLLPMLRAQTGKLQEVVEQLRGIDTRDRRFPSGNVPPAAQKLLPQFKAGLREIIGRTLTQHASSSPESLRGQILADLKKEGIEVLNESQQEGYTADGDNFGNLYDVIVRQPPHQPELLAVVTNLTIPCGSDASLSLYRHAGAAWQPILLVESNGYTDVAGAQGSFQFAVSPPDEEGNWFVVTADVNPWCSSNWQQLRYQVLRPGTDAQHPEVLHDEHTTVYLGTEQPYKLTINPHGFEIRHVAYQGLDSSILTRVHVEKYEVGSGTVKRVPPLALAPEDFLDEWLDLKWEGAAAWTSNRDTAKLQYWHGRLSHEGREKIDTEFAFVQSCPGMHNSKWQIGLMLEGTGENDLPGDLPDELFFTITKRDGVFYLESVDNDRPPGCPGNALPRGAALP